jgi:membrane protein YqaA with SNARE-associated domain
MTDFLLNLGYTGMFLAAFLAGSVIPFSSEAVMAGFFLSHAFNTLALLTAATIGNTGGSMFNYWLGSHADAERVATRLRVKPSHMPRATRWTQRYGSWMALFTFLPILGSAISIALGVMRVSWWKVTLLTFIGKTVRYIVVLGTLQIF